MTSVLVIWLGIGACNVAWAIMQGTLMLWEDSARSRLAGMLEMGFYVWLWPLQLLFWVCVMTMIGLEWVFEKIAG